MSKTSKNKGTLEDLISSGRGDDIHHQKHSYEMYGKEQDHEFEDQRHQQSSLSDNEDVIVFSQNNHTQSADSPSQIQFSQSFTGSYRFAGTQSVRAHSPIQKASSIEMDKLRKQIALKDNQIKQLNDFLNKKRKQQGGFNSIYSKEMQTLNEKISTLQQQKLKQNIIITELNKKLQSGKQELKKYQRINDQNYKQLMKHNQNLLIFSQFKKQIEDNFNQSNNTLKKIEEQNEKLKEQNIKLKESNRKMTEILGENVGQFRIGGGSRISRDVSPRNSAVMINNNANTAAIKQRQQFMKVQQDLTTAVNKYEQLKKKNSQRDKVSIQQKQQIMKLQNNLQSKQKVIESLNKQLGDKSQQLRNIKDRQERISEMENKIKNLQVEKEKNKTRISAQTNQLADKNKKLLEHIKNESELQSKLEMEVNKAKQSGKEIGVLNQKIEGNRKIIKKLEKQIESLKDNQINTKKEQVSIKDMEKKQEELRLQTQKSLDKCKKELSQKELLITQMKKKIEELDKRQQQAIKSNTLARQEEIQKLLKEVTVQKQKSKKQSIEMTKKQSQLQRLQNKIMILEARVSKTSYVNQASVNQELEDRIQSLEIIIEKRNQTIKELERQLERHRSNQIQKQISHDLVNYNLKEMRGVCEISEDDISTNSIVGHLKQQLEQKYQMIRLLKNDNQKKDKAIEFAMQKFLTAEQEKLMMEQNIGRGTIYSALQDSTEQDYNGRNTEEDRQYDILLSRCQMLQERNKSLQVKIKQMQQSGRYRSGPSTQFTKTSYNSKLQNIKLRDQNQQLRDQINSLLAQNKRKSNIQKLTSDQLIELLIDVLKKIYKSSQLIKIVARNPQFLDLVRRITRREEKNSEPVLVSKRSY